MAKTYLLTITVTILLVCIYHGETVDTPAKPNGPTNGIQKPPPAKPPAKPPVKPPTQTKPPVKPPTQTKPPVKPPTQAKPPVKPSTPAGKPPVKPPTNSRTTPHGTHGGVPMGVPTPYCDNGIRGIQIDYDKRLMRKVCSPRFCTKWKKGLKTILQKLRGKKTPSAAVPVATTPVVQPVEECARPQDIQEPIHVCLNEKITYATPIPTSGKHRPLWPKYGEYVYLPPQRWIHNLEHGGIVFLYHPCADQEQIQQLRTIAFSCLQKIIITPSYDLTVERPFAVVSYGCKLLLPTVNKERITTFIKTKALTAPEKDVTKEGQYDRGLIGPVGAGPVGAAKYEDGKGTKCPVTPKGKPKVHVSGDVKNKKVKRKLRRMQCKHLFMLAVGKWGQKWKPRRRGGKHRGKPWRRGQNGRKNRGKARRKGGKDGRRPWQRGKKNRGETTRIEYLNRRRQKGKGRKRGFGKRRKAGKKRRRNGVAP